MPLLQVENLSKTFDEPTKLLGSEQFLCGKRRQLLHLTVKKPLRLLVKMVRVNQH